MATRRPGKNRRDKAHHHHHSLSSSHLPVHPPTDYDTDTYYPSDNALPLQQPHFDQEHYPQMQNPPEAHNGPLRTTADLNLSVLRSYNPSIASIVSIAPFAVLYSWNLETEGWEKSNMEGSLFICALDHDHSLPGYQRFVAVILNRRALGVFATLLEKTEDIELTEEYVILRVKGDLSTGALDADGAEDSQGEEGKIYGLWIFSDPGSSTADTRRNMAAVIKECASMAEKTRAAAEDALKLEEASRQQRRHDQEAGPQAEVMGRQLSLTDLFSRQREADAGFSVKQHQSPGPHASQALAQAPREPPRESRATQAALTSYQTENVPESQTSGVARFQNSADTDFFRGASPYQAALQQRNGTGQGIGGVVGAGQNALLDLFKNAKPAPS